jgi:hypothetical protein
VTLGLAAGGRFPAREIAPYVIAQVLGAVIGAATLYAIASGAPGFDVAKGFAANGYDSHSPGGYSLVSAMLAEIVLTMAFLFIIMGATHGKAPVGFAPIAIGLALTLIHLVGIPVTNTSVNPARSTGPALFVGGWAMAQLWLFWLAPIVGALLAGAKDVAMEYVPRNANPYVSRVDAGTIELVKSFGVNVILGQVRRQSTIRPFYCIQDRGMYGCAHTRNAGHCVPPASRPSVSALKAIRALVLPADLRPRTSRRDSSSHCLPSLHCFGHQRE